MDDEDIRDGLRAGAPGAFRALRDRHGRAIFVVCKRVLGTDSEAEEAMQDAMIRSYEKRAHLAEARSIKAYVLTLAHHIAIDRVRKRQRRTALDRLHTAEVSSDVAPPELQRSIDREALAALAECVEGLDVTTREAILAYRDGDQSWEQIGKQMDVTPDAARMRVNRGLKALRACLDAKGHSP